MALKIERYNAECHGLFMNVIMLSVVMLNVMAPAMPVPLANQDIPILFCD
jgi:hypothetical protein